MPTHEDLIYMVERAKLEMIYSRASLRQFQRSDDPDTVNSVGALISKMNDAIKESENLLTKLR